MFHLRRTIAIVSLIAILLAAVVPSGSVLLWTFIVPLLFFVENLSPLGRRTIFEKILLPASPLLSNSCSRAPPNY
ncbi:MAG TPA: hypothetical protein VGN44_21310 [Candidatus Angelobacter sp.]|jgi:uncharacterized protein (DUF58 family)